MLTVPLPQVSSGPDCATTVPPPFFETLSL